MAEHNRIVSTGPDDGTVRTADGMVLRPPPDWMLLPPGDAALTRRVKAAGPTWTVQEKRGRKTFSRGMWAPAATVTAVRAALAEERATPQYEKRLAAGRRRREQEQSDYVADFRQAVHDYLAFAPEHADLAGRLAEAVTRHATPVGSGTVARTERIPIDRRAEAAVIAWMRHQTTAYEHMVIPRIKGQRREVRRMLAQRSKQVLEAYRRGSAIPAECPLRRALAGEAPCDPQCGT